MTSRISRRAGLGLAATAVAGLAARKLLAASPSPERTMQPTDSKRMPSIFLAHGAPPLLDDPKWMGELATWGQALPKPTAILVLSAHWLEQPVTLGATTPVPLVYDFYGFPERYYRMTYASPGAPKLAERVKGLLSAAGQAVAAEPERGLDHGAYVPLMAMYPKADVPVLQVSLPSLEPQTLFTLGQALAPLRDEGVLLLGSGFITHNLRQVDWSGRSAPASWATEFDEWVAQTVLRHDVDGLLDYRAKAPGWRESLPTTEHFVPLITAMGAAADGKTSFPISGWWMGSFTKRSVQFG